jgi:hypothetical protein
MNRSSHLTGCLLKILPISKMQILSIIKSGEVNIVIQVTWISSLDIITTSEHYFYDHTLRMLVFSMENQEKKFSFHVAL